MIEWFTLILAYIGGRVIGRYTYFEIKNKKTLLKKSFIASLILTIIILMLFLLKIVPDYFLILSACFALFFKSNLDFLNKKK